MSIARSFANVMHAATRPRHGRRAHDTANDGAHTTTTATTAATTAPTPPLSAPVSWGLTLIVAFFGALLRIVRLGEPRAVVFDETYYVKDAWTMLNTGEPRDWPDSVVYDGASVSPNIPFAHGDVGGWLSSAEYVVHPPFGKWLIALGLKLCGGAQHVYAWRIATALAGVAAIVILIRLTLRLWRNMPIALVAGYLMAIDGVGIVLSRTGLLDNFIMVLALGAFMLLVMHRDWSRRRLFAAHEADPDGRPPQIAFSWYRVGAAILLGLTTGVKWSGTYFFAVFCVISVLWDAWLYHQAGYRRWFLNAGLGSGLLAALVMIPLYALSYLATWIGWFIHPDSYMHDWALSHPGQGVQWLPPTARSFVEYHRQMWQFHTTLDTPHDYKANPLTWPLQIRPTSFYWQKLGDHPGLCSLAPKSECVAAVTSLGNPVIWWLGSLCTLVAIGIAIAKRGDWRIWAVLAGFFAGWLPWVQYLHRTTFTFYSIVLLPWIILAICYVLDWIRTTCSPTLWRATLTAVLAVTTLVSIFFYSIWTAMPVPYEFWLSHMWFDSWI